MAKTNEKQVAKKKRIVPPSYITNFFSKSNQTQPDFLKDLMLYIVKGYHPLSFIENPWLRGLVLCQCKWV